jgi:hypothetical protein
VRVAHKVLRGEQPEPFKNHFMTTSPVDRANVAEIIALHLWD